MVQNPLELFYKHPDKSINHRPKRHTTVSVYRTQDTKASVVIRVCETVFSTLASRCNLCFACCSWCYAFSWIVKQKLNVNISTSNLLKQPFAILWFVFYMWVCFMLPVKSPIIRQLEFGMYPQSMPTEWTHARTLRPWQSVRLDLWRLVLRGLSAKVHQTWHTCRATMCA